MTRFDNFVVASDIKTDAQKTALLLHYMEELHEINCALSESPATTSVSHDSSSRGGTPLYTATHKMPDVYIEPQVSIAFKIHRLRHAKQREDESRILCQTAVTCAACAFVNPDFEVKNQILLSTTSSRLPDHAA